MCEIVSYQGSFYGPPPGQVQQEDGIFFVPPLPVEQTIAIVDEQKETHELFCHHGDENWEKLELDEDQAAVCPAGTVLKLVPKTVSKP